MDKVGKNYSGTTFPGGHVEEGETFAESVIREIYEETIRCRDAAGVGIDARRLCRRVFAKAYTVKGKVK